MGDDEWLGYGVYFFIDGISSALTSAEEWAKAEAWDNAGKKFTYRHFAVVSVRVFGEEVLDLRNEKDLRLFNEARLELYAKHDALFDPNEREQHDRILMNLLLNLMEFEIVICNLFIKSSYLRRMRLGSRIPNATVLCVRKSENIDLTTMQVVKKGVVYGKS